jgi:hypothetical protein
MAKSKIQSDEIQSDEIAAENEELSGFDDESEIEDDGEADEADDEESEGEESEGEEPAEESTESDGDEQPKAAKRGGRPKLERDEKECKTHPHYFPAEPSLRPIDEFANGGKHSYCRRCMSLRSKDVRDAKNAAEGKEPRAPKQPKAAKEPKEAKASTSSKRGGKKAKVEPQNKADLTLGADPAENTPFLVIDNHTHQALPGGFAFREYELFGDEYARVRGVHWTDREDVTAQMVTFPLDAVVPAMEQDVERAESARLIQIAAAEAEPVEA